MVPAYTYIAGKGFYYGKGNKFMKISDYPRVPFTEDSLLLGGVQKEDSTIETSLFSLGTLARELKIKMLPKRFSQIVNSPSTPYIDVDYGKVPSDFSGGFLITYNKVLCKTSNTKAGTYMLYSVSTGSAAMNSVTSIAVPNLDLKEVCDQVTFLSLPAEYAGKTLTSFFEDENGITIPGGYQLIAEGLLLYY